MLTVQQQMPQWRRSVNIHYPAASALGKKNCTIYSSEVQALVHYHTAQRPNPHKLSVLKVLSETTLPHAELKELESNE